VLIDGGSGLNFIFTKTLDKMKLDITHMLTKSASPFCGIVLGNVTIPLSSVVLPVTFGETRENYRTEYIKFEVADFETSIHAILGRPSIAKFMEVPHYTYLILKMPSPAGVLSLQGDLKISFDCDTEVVELATTNQVPNPMMEIYAASKKLAPTELEIPKKTGTTNNPQPSEEVCWGGVSENPDKIPEHKRREWTNVQVKVTNDERGDKESPNDCSCLKSCESFYTCPRAPFYREAKGLLHSENTLESREYS
jgi:hypothetical protein